MAGVAQILYGIVNHPLSRHRPLPAIWRFVSWQVSCRLATQAVVKPWVNGTRLRVRRGETGLTGNLYTGLFEFADMAFVAHCLRRSDLFIDVGANAGAYTVLASGVAGAQTVAFEPIPETCQRLRLNISLNDLDQLVSVYECALGAHTGRLRMSRYADTTNRVIDSATTERDSSGETDVCVRDLDSVLADQNPAIIKIDVEGFELPVLQGATRTLENPVLKALLVEMNGSGVTYGFSELEIVSTLTRYGFSAATYDPWKRSLLACDFQRQMQGNALFVRDIDWLAERCRNGQTLNVYGNRI